jgi:hypothetical protein
MTAPRSAPRPGPRVTVVVLVALAAALLVVWFLRRNNAPTVGAYVDAPVYSSFEELAAASDAVVVGTVSGVAAREVDYGTDNPTERDGPGIPVAFYEVNVTEVLLGQTQAKVIVGGPDGEQIVSESVTPFRAGETVMLFLREQTHEDAPGISSYDFFYTPISLDNGVFDLLSGDRVRPRMPEAFTESATDVGAVGAPVFTLNEVRARVSEG